MLPSREDDAGLPGWWLTDAGESRRRSPYTFYQPSAATIGKLAIGDSVKLIFEFDNPDPEGYSAERMWVTVTRIDGERFEGELDNEPRQLKALKLGDPVRFEARHIIQTQIEEIEPDIVQKYLARCFVTRKVLYEGKPVNYLYRETPDKENDSGWRIMAGDESEAYMDDSDNIFYVSLGAVLNRDDSFVDLLDAQAGSAFERDSTGSRFVALD